MSFENIFLLCSNVILSENCGITIPVTETSLKLSLVRNKTRNSNGNSSVSIKAFVVFSMS